MLTRYLEYLDRTSDAAVVRRISTGEYHSNERGRALLAAASDVFHTSVQKVVESGEIALCVIDTVELAFVPLFDEHQHVEAVLATSAALVELPRILHQLHSTMRHFAQIVHLLPQIVLTARPNGRIDYASRRWAEVAQVERRAADTHASFFGAFEKTERDAVGALWRSGIAGGVEFGFESCMRTVSGPRWYALRATPWKLGDGAIIKWAVSLTDVDSEVRARTALERSQRRLHLLAEIGQTLNGAIDPAVIARDAVRSLARWSGGTAVAELRSDGERVAARAQPADGQLLIERLSASFVRGEAAPTDIPGMLAVAICGHLRGTRGFLAIAHGEIEEPDEDRALLAEVASRVAVAFESALAYRREHRTAEVLQRAMLPVALPQVPGISFDVAYAPSGGEILVGGDWYDGFLLRNGHVAFVIGDVAGHGLDAAIVMANVRRTIRAAALNERDPAVILECANVVALAERCPMVTAFLGILDPLTLRLEYACAGHPPPIVLDSAGTLYHLEPDGPPLGVVETLGLRTATVTLSEGSALVLYTDGVIEAHHENSTGELALSDALRAWSARGFAETAEALQGAIIGDVASDDDAAMLIVRLISPDELNVTFPATAIGSHRARAAVERFVNATTLGVDRAFDFTLAVAEATNNAAEHAYGGATGEVSLHMWLNAAELVAVVADRGLWRLATASDRGRGLQMMERLADACDVESSDSGTTVTLAMRLPVAAVAARSA